MPSGASCCWRTPGARTHATSRAPWCPRCRHGLVVRMLEDEAKELDLPAGHGVELVTAEDAGPTECELAVVIGGDGTILRAAELTHGTSTPLLGVNLGHVGFLAEAESEDVEKMIELIVGRQVLQRGAADPRRVGLPRQGARRDAPGRSTRPASRRPPASGCSRWSSRSTAAR